ncbi:MAG TPA: threonylcarbamoyl-AMP synthase [Marinilabiliales bacterium]|nr:MAG: threonylcarbamoyl-AMP synthase [Bacteroidetes bacterium GWC2_40_13]OFX75718.1 MAG: threonylcarbamoyl-AMP synthase [Bacteroidetes bacterium GWD2_40_43]OFX95009.1 MAG: threonylcarbamoyl-AMP synthase [Bacteroidetes bacterium GWE2_40_63]OFY23520.1 MAG: threonylcarbamoyl-AMP synthase [Bacteroidetes bacterium GWF2_40_13]OFZ29354.1 MAG: threonylcarbamoyl-AMP synthase [Bacteroidetes bacterium RIFOXYC2_FULL_40_12]HAM98587.1 threonylcarbamoyl-AMP synthase [Marinilabiliales bacterium]
MREDIKTALEVLRNGGIILYPTDTIWGLGCDATNPDAVQKIFEIKKRSDNKSMIVLVDHPGRIASYIDEVPEIAFEVIELAESPLTVILEGAKNLAPNVVNQEDKSVGIRVVKEPFCQQLIQQFKRPIVSTSANISGDPSPAIFDDIEPSIMASADYVVKYRQGDLQKAKPSGIIKIGKEGLVKVIRE